MSFLSVVGALLVLLVHLLNSTAVGFNTEVGNGNASYVMCKERERKALLSLKQGFKDECDRLSSWGSAGGNQKDCCKWEGVHCSGKTGHVVMLDLRGTRNPFCISPVTVNSALAELHHLSYLDLSFNDIWGDFPKFIVSLTHLKYLNLSSSPFNGTNRIIPSELGNLVHLKYLDLSDAWLVGEFPTFFQNFSRLVYLDLGRNRLTGKIPHFFANISSLEYLDLSENHFTGKIPHSFENLFHLKYLDLTFNGYHDLRSDLEWVSPLTSLKSLKLSDVDLSTANNWQLQLGNLSYLQQLELNDCNLGGSIPKSLLDICSLSVLDLSFNNLSGMLDDFLSISTICANKSLENLHLSGNLITGSVSHLSKFSALQTLRLGDNRLNGTVSESIGELQNLEDLDLSYNFLHGVISEAHFSELSKLTHLDLSSNALIFNVSNDWIPPFQLEGILLASCKLGCSFPTWIRTQKYYSMLDISSAGIFDTTPNWLWHLSPSTEYLNLSNNQICGEIPNLSIEYTDIVEMDLSSNMFQGSIPPFLSTTGSLDLSNNKLSNVEFFLCANTTKIVAYLDLSNNQLSGKLPECWAHFDSLDYLDLTNNTLSGKVPTSIGLLSKLQAFRVRRNNFSGELPFSMKNCKELTFLDAAQNNFSGSIPTWIGDGLPNLVILVLRFNLFSGSLPSNLCQLAKVQILDLSFNNISGSIPKCLNNLAALTSKVNSSPTISYQVSITNNGSSSIYSPTDYSASLSWKGKESVFQGILGLVRSIGLSSNKLNGEIPNEIMDLNGLISLNISRNRISGEIPATIGQLKSLDVLDLSRNQLRGKIPSQISQLGLLSVLDLSYNNLSGEIPNQNFDASSYTGNLKLCGIPLPKCSNDQTDDTQNDGNHGDNEPFFTQGFYISMAIGFGVGFWGVCSSLIFKKSWRYAYFNFLNNIYDNLYVMVAINMAKFQRWIRAST